MDKRHGRTYKCHLCGEENDHRGMKFIEDKGLGSNNVCIECGNKGIQFGLAFHNLRVMLLGWWNKND